MKSRYFLSCFICVLLATAPHVHAATNVSILFDGTGVNGATCADADLDYHFLLTATTDDGAGCDYIAVITFDGYGNPLDVDFLCYGTGPVYYQTEYTDMGTIANPAARPIWVAIYKIPAPPGGMNENTVAAAQWVLSFGPQAFRGSSNIDPAPINTACATLPIGTFSPLQAYRIVGAPTLSLWGFLTAAGFMALTAFLCLRRRRVR
jgi:hypothetical protein